MRWPADAGAGTSPAGCREMLDRMLVATTAPLLERHDISTSVARRGRGTVHLPHRTRPDESIAIHIERDEIFVICWYLRSHHFADRRGRPWVLAAVDLVRQLLLGEIEVEATLRSGRPLRVCHVRHDRGGGSPEPLDCVPVHSLLRLAPFLPVHTESRRISFQV